MEAPSNSLLDLLSNSLILRQTSPYLPLSSLLKLSATSTAFRDLLVSSPEAFPYLDLRRVRSAAMTLDFKPIDSGGQAYRAERMDEALTEDEFYSGPILGVFSKLARPKFNVLAYVQILILDGMIVPADLVREIVAEDRFSVKILSIRKCIHLNHVKLCQILKYAVRTSRREGTPKLRGLYVFGGEDRVTAGSRKNTDAPSFSARIGVTDTEGAQIGAQIHSKPTSQDFGLPEDRWYRSMGRVIRPASPDWASTLQACSGIIAFDAVLCRGPRHDPRAGKNYLPPAIATVALGQSGCEICHSCPEGPALFGTDPEDTLPLLAPPPLHSATARAAQKPHGQSSKDGSRIFPRLIVRCEDCLGGRWCERCNKWWCEICYSEPVSRANAEIGTGSSSTTSTGPYWSNKVYMNVCVDNCLRSEILAVADGMWG